MYTPQAIEKFVDGSLSHLGTEKLDMILLHCPPTSVYRNDEMFTKLEQLKAGGKLIDYGVSIETVEEGLLAMEVIFNMFRLKPLEQLFPTAQQKNVGIIARVPLASGLLTGRYNAFTQFGKDDHRTFNRNGEAFDKGEIFSGVDYQLGLQAVEELKALFGTEDLIPYALRWVLMNEAVSTVIPGASKVSQVITNAAVDNFPPLTENEMQKVEDIYNRLIRPSVHHLWIIYPTL